LEPDHRTLSKGFLVSTSVSSKQDLDLEKFPYYR